MRPEHYVKIEIVQGGGGLSSPVIAGALLWVLHGVFRDNPGKYAISIPDHGFAWIHVFAEQREDLDFLHESVKDNATVNRYCRFGYPQKVPDNFSGPWKRYWRYRIPGRNAERNDGGTVRLRRTEKATEARLPYFILQSKTNRNRFSLHVRVERHEQSPQDNDCRPDSYGLSVTTRPFVLPALP